MRTLDVLAVRLSRTAAERSPFHRLLSTESGARRVHLVLHGDRHCLARIRGDQRPYVQFQIRH